MGVFSKISSGLTKSRDKFKASMYDLIGRGPGCLVPPDAQYLREAGAKIGEKASSQKERGRSGQLPGARRRTDRGKATGRPTPKKRGRF